LNRFGLTGHGPVLPGPADLRLRINSDLTVPIC